MDKINGNQLRQTISVLCQNFTVDEILHHILNKLTLDQLQQIAREFLNTAWYGKAEKPIKEPKESKKTEVTKNTEVSKVITSEPVNEEVPSITELVVAGDIDGFIKGGTLDNTSVLKFISSIEDGPTREYVEALAQTYILNKKEEKKES